MTQLQDNYKYKNILHQTENSLQDELRKDQHTRSEKLIYIYESNIEIVKRKLELEA